MAKTIDITYKGVSYTLEFSRRSLDVLFNKLCFTPSDSAVVQLVQLPKLFRGAFFMHHPRVEQRTVDELYDALVKQHGTSTLLTKLTELYYEPLSAMLEEPENGGGEKNAELEISW